MWRLLHRIGLDAELGLAADRRIRPVGQRRHQLAAGQVEGPAVIGAGEHAGKRAAPHRQRHAAVRAAVTQRIRRAAVASQHDLLAQQRNRPDSLAKPTRFQNRVPVMAEPKARRLVSRPAAPRSMIVRHRTLIHAWRSRDAHVGAGAKTTLYKRRRADNSGVGRLRAFPSLTRLDVGGVEDRERNRHDRVAMAGFR